MTARRAGKDPRTDVYQLGLVLYELLTLERAFHADEVTELLKKIVDGDFVRPRARCTEIPPELEDVCLKAMELDPSARYQSALELREDLERFATGSAAPLAGSRGVMVRAARNARYFARRRKGMLAAAALVLLGGAIGALLLRDTNDPHGPIRAFIANADDSDARFVRDEGVVHPGETICIDMDGVEAGWLYAVNVFYPPSGAEPLVRPIREREFDGNPQRISLVSVEDGTPAGQREGFVVFRSRERSPSLFEWITLMELENRPITLAEANASLGRRLNATTRGGSEGMRPSAVREVREEAPKDALFPAIAHLEVFRTFLRVER